MNIIEKIYEDLKSEIDAKLGDSSESLSACAVLEPELFNQIEEREKENKRQDKIFEKAVSMLNKGEHIKDPERFNRFLKRNKLRFK